jgi:hypothetical protein
MYLTFLTDTTQLILFYSSVRYVSTNFVSNMYIILTSFIINIRRETQII